VTGSRITSPNLTAISPITSVDAGYIGSTNLTRVEDILNNLPMVFAGQNSTVSNGADGTATVNLRGLGPNAPWFSSTVGAWVRVPEAAATSRTSTRFPPP
jgi:hypothetical protein